MNRPRRVRELLISALLLLLPRTFCAASTTFELLRIDTSPRGAALSGYPLGLLRGDLGAIGTHPGALAFARHQQVSAAYSNYPLDISGGGFTYGVPFDFGYGAISLGYLNYGSFDRRASLDEAPTGTFSPSDMLFTAALGRKVIANLGAGVSLKYIRSQIDTYSSSAAALDLSAHWITGFHMVDLAAGISNAGIQLSAYNDSKEALPAEAHLSAAKLLEHLPLQICVTGHGSMEGGLWGSFAGEFTVSPVLKLRVGYSSLGTDYHVGGSRDSLAGLTAGLGVSWLELGLDYAFSSQGAIGQVHRFGVIYTF